MQNVLKIITHSKSDNNGNVGSRSVRCFPDIDFETLVNKSTPLNFRGYFEKFSNRERQIICMNAHGCSTKYICEALCISPATFKTYLSQIYQKIFFVCNDRNDNFSKRTRLALYYLQAIGKLDDDWHIE